MYLFFFSVFLSHVSRRIGFILYMYQNNRRFQRPNRPQRPSFQRGGAVRRQKFIDPHLFVKRSVEQVTTVYTPTHTFAEFTLTDQLKLNVTQRGYVSPTPIQDQAIPALLEGRDVVGIAATGTGKTAAFLLTILNTIAKDPNKRALIVAPTRELAVQIQDEMRIFSRSMRIYSALCIGGVPIYSQITQLRRNPQVIIGTPGRLKDLEQQRCLDFRSFQTIVLDEVDRMLDMGFVHDVTYIITRLPKPRQSIFFSATMTDSVKSVMGGFLTNPVMVTVKSNESSANVDQDVIKLAGRLKTDVLDELLRKDGFDKVLVFGRTKHGLEKLQRELYKRGVTASAIHGNKRQNQRLKAIEDFKNNRTQVLLATDIASRGLDIDDVTHVINYYQPESYEDYIHRIGRTGRANKKGIALTFVE